jgi:DNA-binding LytR/AlgR family response regulator
MTPLRSRAAGDEWPALARLLERRAPAHDVGTRPLRVSARRDRTIVLLDLDEVWACEAADRLTFVHSARGRFDLDLTLSCLESSFGAALTRVHRRWLVNPARVLELDRASGDTTLFVGSAAQSPTRGVRVPVARERAVAVREALLADALGIRRV